MARRDFFAGEVLPYERPEKPTRLHERLEGRQLSRLQWLLTPDDCWGIGLELTSGARIILWSMRDGSYDVGQSKYRYRLMIRFMAPHQIIPPRGRRYWGYGRDSGLRTAVTPHDGPDLGEEAADEIQERFEGDVIVGASPTYEPNEQGCERIEVEFRSGWKLRLDALPPKPGSRDKADLAVIPIEPLAKTTIWMPGMPT